MILLAKSFLKRYFFAVVQTASKPHPTRGRTTLIARTRRKAGARQYSLLKAFLTTNHTKRHEIFRVFRAFRGQKKILIVDQWRKSTVF
jgi:hypothetical protein